MMDYARETTLWEVRNLTTTQLDFLPDAQSNSIGALLYHIAATEIWYQVYTFEGRKMTSEEEEPLLAAFDLGELGRSEIRGHELSFYLEILASTRAKTLAGFAERDDDWLYQEFPFWGKTGNNYFCWFHVFEDELSHRGQIRILKKRLKEQ